MVKAPPLMDDLRFLLLLTFCLCLASWLLLSWRKENKRLPPGPLYIPLLTPILWTRRSLLELWCLIRRLRTEHGPIFTLRFATGPAIFIADRRLAHDALIHNGAAFSDRMRANAAARILNSYQHSISSAGYGPLWRLLRRNLTSGILHPSRVRLFGGSCRWALKILVGRLRDRAEVDGGVAVALESFQYAMFCLLLLMCFGEKLDKKQIEDIEAVERILIKSFIKFHVFYVCPKITKIVLLKIDVPVTKEPKDNLLTRRTDKIEPRKIL